MKKTLTFALLAAIACFGGAYAVDYGGSACPSVYEADTSDAEYVTVPDTSSCPSGYDEFGGNADIYPYGPDLCDSTKGTCSNFVCTLQ